MAEENTSYFRKLWNAYTTGLTNQPLLNQAMVSEVLPQFVPPLTQEQTQQLLDSQQAVRDSSDNINIGQQDSSSFAQNEAMQQKLHNEELVAEKSELLRREHSNWSDGEVTWNAKYGVLIENSGNCPPEERTQYVRDHLLEFIAYFNSGINVNDHLKYQGVNNFYQLANIPTNPTDPNTCVDHPPLTQEQIALGHTYEVFTFGQYNIPFITRNGEVVSEDIERFHKLTEMFVYDPQASLLENAHKGLSLAGFTPGIGFVPDLADSALYVGEGKWKEALFSGGAAIPGAGDAFAALRMGSKAVKGIEAATEIDGAATKLSKGADKAGPNITESPVLKDSPYNPDTVADRVKPEYKANPAHDPGSSLFNPRKTPEPTDAASVYQISVRADMGTWYGQGADGQIYRYFSDNAGGAHFSGIVSKEQVPADILRQLGIKY
ncbi:MAG: hypothetical protein H6Q73_3365 [Firmicutes bacterium]|nr:hypothetical protein [Bacillota bacterium]